MILARRCVVLIIIGKMGICLLKDITDKIICRGRRSLRGTNFEYTALISHDLINEQISVHKKKLHKQSCTKPHSNVDFKKACKLVAISFHFFLDVHLFLEASRLRLILTLSGLS